MVAVRFADMKWVPAAFSDVKVPKGVGDWATGWSWYSDKMGVRMNPDLFPLTGVGNLLRHIREHVVDRMVNGSGVQ